MVAKLPTVEAIPLWQLFFSLLCHNVLCTISYTNALNQLPFWEDPYSPQVSNILAILPALGFMTNLGFPSWMPFPKTRFFNLLVGSPILGSQFYEFTGGNLKLTPIHEGQGETKKQIGRLLWVALLISKRIYI